MFVFSVFGRKYSLFWKFVSKIKIVSWSWNLEPRLIQICRKNSKIRWYWYFSFFFFIDRKYPSCVNLVQKFKRVSVRRNLVPRLIWICKILWCSLFYFRTFLQVLSKNQFSILMLSDFSSSSLVAETWSQWLFLFHLKSYFHSQYIFVLTFWSCRKTAWLRQGYIVKIFFQSISWNTVSGAFDETWTTFMKYFCFSI